MNADIIPTGDGDFVVVRPAPNTETLRPADSIGSGPPVAQPATALPVPPEPTAVAGSGGSMADYDRLVAALEAYDAETGPGPVRIASYLYLAAAADVCGRPIEEPPLAWSRRRVATYRAQMSDSFFALACSIVTTNSLLRAIGEDV